MKLTKTQLKQIVKEELDKLTIKQKLEKDPLAWVGHVRTPEDYSGMTGSEEEIARDIALDEISKSITDGFLKMMEAGEFKSVYHKEYAKQVYADCHRILMQLLPQVPEKNIEHACKQITTYVYRALPYLLDRRKNDLAGLGKERAEDEREWAAELIHEVEEKIMDIVLELAGAGGHDEENLTESQLKQIIKEGLSAELGDEASDQAVINMLTKLLDAIEGLDISIDFLAGAVTGRRAYDVGMAQKSIGRGATAESKGNSE